jgi:Domain of unknown function (DUF1996)
MRRIILLPACVGIAVLLACVVALLAALSLAPAASAASSDHGASFAVRCDFTHRASDDPIVHPGHQGMAHSHDFFGNRSTKHNSTYKSLRAAGTTCTRQSDKAAYWMPTVKWNGKALESNRAVFYYRAGSKAHKKVQAHLARLQVVTPHNRRVSWRCGRTDNGNGSRTPPKRCNNGELGVRVIFPDCSNGKLDSGNHRSHMAYSRRIDGKVRCPKSHPRSVPVLSMNVTFDIPAGQRGKVTLSSGGAWTMHADFFNAWKQKTLTALVKRCINQVPPWKPRPEVCRA